MKPSLSAVVVAAGRARRFQESSGIQTNKVLCALEGVPMIRRTLDALFLLPIHKLSLVVRPEEETYFCEALEGAPYWGRIVFAAGGSRRQDSVRSGLLPLAETSHVLIHDGARPFLQREFLERLWDRAQKTSALIPVQPISETLKEIGSDGIVIRTVNRDRFVRVQTPQFFRLDFLKEVHEQLRTSSHEFTDDAAMFENLGHRVETVTGHSHNVKVTFAEDLKGVAHA